MKSPHLVILLFFAQHLEFTGWGCGNGGYNFTGLTPLERSMPFFSLGMDLDFILCSPLDVIKLLNDLRHYQTVERQWECQLDSVSLVHCISSGLAPKDTFKATYMEKVTFIFIKGQLKETRKLGTSHQSWKSSS